MITEAEQSEQFENAFFDLQDAMEDICMLADITHSFVDSMTGCASSQDHLVPAELSEDDGLIRMVDLRRAAWCHGVLGKWLDNFKGKYEAALKLKEIEHMPGRHPASEMQACFPCVAQSGFLGNKPAHKMR